MSTLIRGGKVAADEFLALSDDEDLPESAAVVVSLARWQAQAKLLLAGNRPVALRLPNTSDVRMLYEDVRPATAVVLDFPGFADGRAYSQARILRDELGFGGEIRATGAAVVRDQLHGMLRCGIDAFELRGDQSVPDFLSAMTDFSLAYQPAADALPRIVALRRERPRA